MFNSSNAVNVQRKTGVLTSQLIVIRVNEIPSGNAFTLGAS